MTVSSQTNNATFLGNGVSTVFPLPFRFFSNNDVFAYFIDSTTGSSTPMALGIDYTLTGAGEPEVNGNAVSVLTTTVPLQTGRGLYVERNMAPIQSTDIVNQGEFFASTHEDVFDRLTMLIQQGAFDVSRAIRVPDSDPEPDALPSAINRADKLLSFDASGNPIARAASVGSSDELALDLANWTNQSKGASLIGYKDQTLYEYLEKTENGALWFSRDLGGNPDGVTDNSAAFAAAIALGKPIYFEPGSYLVETFEQVPASGCRLIGAGMPHTELVFVAPNTTARNAFVLSNANVTFEQIKVRISGPVGATVQTFALRASNLTFDTVEVDGGNTPGNANVVNAFNFADAAVENLRVMNCDIHNVQRVNLRTNTNTGAATNLLYMGNRFRAMGQGGLQFNFPLGSISGVRVIGNFFKDFHAGTEQIYTGGASLTNATFANNVFAGLAKECLHLEEAGDNISVTGNVFAANAHGVFLGDNNVAGSYAAPSRITITGNSFIDGSLTRLNEGVRAPNNGVGGESYSGLVIADNVIRGYDRGLNIASGSQSVTNNAIINCNIGVRSEKLGPWLSGNTFQNCSTAISGVNGSGLVGKNRFVDVINYATSDDGSRVSMAGFTLDATADFSLPGSTATLISTALPLAAANRMYGSLRCAAGLGSSTLYRHRISEITWDGTTLTDTEKAAVGSGAIALTGFVLDSGLLKARFNNTGTAQTGKHFSIEFDGLWTSAA